MPLNATISQEQNKQGPLYQSRESGHMISLVRMK